jgi:hypothetical protein
MKLGMNVVGHFLVGTLNVFACMNSEFVLLYRILFSVLVVLSVWFSLRPDIWYCIFQAYTRIAVTATMQHYAVVDLVPLITSRWSETCDISVVILIQLRLMTVWKWAVLPLFRKNLLLPSSLSKHVMTNGSVSRLFHVNGESHFRVHDHVL